jgi:hypothetical protein
MTFKDAVNELEEKKHVENFEEIEVEDFVSEKLFKDSPKI